MYAKKSLGQHFLTSTKIIADIVAAAEVTSKDTVLEIGPGRGILTRGLLDTGAQVVAVEKDDALVHELTHTFEKEIAAGKLTLIHEDVLKMTPMSGPYKLVANIPYYITGQIIRQFLESKNQQHQPTLMTILIQKEVAERIIARDGKESLLSLSVKAYGTPRLVRTVLPGSFNPPPTVDSAVLTISDISCSKLAGVDEKKFFEILHLGFAHKRKQLLPNLAQGDGEMYTKDHLVEVFEKISLDPTCRAEDVSLETWIELAGKL